MENGTDRYLHKKFKKQLSIDPSKINKNALSTSTAASNPIKSNNTTSVPISQILSTNRNETSPTSNVNTSAVLNNEKSSISNNLVTDSTLNNTSSHSSNNLLVLRFNNGIEYDAVGGGGVLRNNNNIRGGEQHPGHISYAEPTNAQQKSSIFTTKDYYLTNQVDVTKFVQPYELKPPITINADETNYVQQEKGGATSGGKYVCTYCNLACSKPSVLQKHIRAHTNERPYPCVSCGFSFKTRSNLYKHCRSRTHANRVMGNKAQSGDEQTRRRTNDDDDAQNNDFYASTPANLAETIESEASEIQENYQKPYKPRFHTAKQFDLVDTNCENLQNDEKSAKSDLISIHINDLINKNNSIITSDAFLNKRRPSISECLPPHTNNNDYIRARYEQTPSNDIIDEPLNLTKSRKRCLSEVSEPTAQKSLIKELLLKNLYADTNMQCQFCKMIFQTVTELELHKIRSCKGIIKSGPRYSRSSSVNVASILTQNKNAFDNIPHLQHTVFPLKSPGPFLGKTRLVEGDKAKSFSFEDCVESTHFQNHNKYGLPPLLDFIVHSDKMKQPPVKLFGGEVKITQRSGETKCFKIDRQEDKYNNEKNYEYAGKLSENCVVKSTLQSGGTVLQNKQYVKHDNLRSSPETISVYENTSMSPSIDISNLEKTKFNYDYRHQEQEDKKRAEENEIKDPYKYKLLSDFSQNAVKLLTPNLKQLNLSIPGVPVPTKFIESSSPLLSVSRNFVPQTSNHKNAYKMDDNKNKPSTPTYNEMNGFETKKLVQQKSDPLNLFVNGKVVRYVPGMPGPIVAELPTPEASSPIIKTPMNNPDIMITPVDTTPPIKQIFNFETTRAKKMDSLEIKIEMHSPNKSNELLRSPIKLAETPRKFARPNSLALKPSMSSLKQHHGLTPTMFNQILISPDTPRGAKKYNEQYLHGNYFSYLGLKSSTKPVYCTVNKTQPFYVPHFKKLSMYSEWRQQDNKSDKLLLSAYNSQQTSAKYTMAGKITADLMVHSSYKFTVSEISSTNKDDGGKNGPVLGGYESTDDYTYVRGRGRGRYVCDQCGIRCKKPSMLKKHIRTHSNVRPYSCKHCNFSFKTKGNLTKHMKSKAHTKNYAASSSSGSPVHQSGSISSDSDTDDSGMDSSDESSTRNQEHEAAYGLLSLSQKPMPMQSNEMLSPNHSPLSPMNERSPASSFMNTEQINHVSKTNYAKNKSLDQQTSSFNSLKICDITSNSNSSIHDSSMHQFMGGNRGTSRPLTYPYTSTTEPIQITNNIIEKPTHLIVNEPINKDIEDSLEHKNIKNFNVIKRYQPIINNQMEIDDKKQIVINNKKDTISFNNNNKDNNLINVIKPSSFEENDEFLRKRKLVKLDSMRALVMVKKQRNDEVIDLSMRQKMVMNNVIENDLVETLERMNPACHGPVSAGIIYKNNENLHNNRDIDVGGRVFYHINESPVSKDATNNSDYDNSAMDTLADIATKQVKLEKNSGAKNVASEFLKLATKNEYPNGDDKTFITNHNHKEINVLVKNEENKSCTICSKTFNKPSQLKLHMNIHYLERPFRCDICSVSFRTKGHLQKHERSASHHNKLSSSPALSSSEPRPFKCSDCSIAFRIHGHLAKHLRSKMHIMKLECLAKIPFGLYAELERSNSLLTEINTADGDQCLDSLKMLAKKVFMNDPSKLTQSVERPLEQIETDTDS